MNKIFTLLIVTFFSSCVSVQKYNAHIDKKIDVDKLQQDVDFMHPQGHRAVPGAGQSGHVHARTQPVFAICALC